MTSPHLTNNLDGSARALGVSRCNRNQSAEATRVARVRWDLRSGEPYQPYDEGSLRNFGAIRRKEQKMRRSLVLISLGALLLTRGLAAGGEGKPAPDRMRPALVVMDVQNAWLPYMDEKDTKTAMEHINWAIKVFRDNGFPVILVYHTDAEIGPAPGTEAFEFPKTIAIKDDDLKIVKSYSSAFKRTELDRMLKERGVNTVFLVGLSAVGCVLATYHGADDLDYMVFMVKHALISHDAALTKSVYEFCTNISPSALKLLLDTATSPEPRG